MQPNRVITCHSLVTCSRRQAAAAAAAAPPALHCGLEVQVAAQDVELPEEKGGHAAGQRLAETNSNHMHAF